VISKQLLAAAGLGLPLAHVRAAQHLDQVISNKSHDKPILKQKFRRGDHRHGVVYMSFSPSLFKEVENSSYSSSFFVQHVIYSFQWFTDDKTFSNSIPT
jgi:hypothetical protein